MAENIDALTVRRDQINARIQALRVREQAQARKDEVHRKILIGGVVLARIKAGRIPQEWLDKILDDLTSNRDRALFGLPPK